MQSLDATNLCGAWSAVPTPFQAGGAIDYSALHENCRRLAGVGVDGIYTTDSDGEFYAIEFDEFKVLAGEFGRIRSALKMDAQMGVTWSNTRGVIDRIKASVDAGIPTVHVGLPFFMPVPLDDMFRFFADLAAAIPAARWVYYAHPSCLPLLKGSELARLAREFPEQLIGTKLNAYEMHDLTDVFLHCPRLAHFVGERNMLFGALLGAKGCYSYWVNTMPEWALTFIRSCLRQDFERARVMHLKFHRWETVEMAAIRQKGYRHGITSKARGALTGFLLDDRSSRLPYRPVPDELMHELKRRFTEFWQDELTARQ